MSMDSVIVTKKDGESVEVRVGDHIEVGEITGIVTRIEGTTPSNSYIHVLRSLKLIPLSPARCAECGVDLDEVDYLCVNCRMINVPC